MNYISRMAAVVVVIAVAATVVAPFAYAGTADDLKSAIDQKAKQLDEVTRQLQRAQIELTDTQVRGKTLKQEINRIDGNVQSANLNIQVSQLTIEKLRLEIDSVQQDIASKESAVQLKREGVIRLLQTLQEREREGLLLPLLSGESLAKSLADSQNIADLNEGLLADVSQLRQLKQDLTDQLERAADKKKSVENKKANLEAQKAIAQDQLAERQRLLADTKNKEDLYKKQISDLQKQQQDISDEIGSIEDQLRAQYGTASVPMKRPGVFARPIERGAMTQDYGVTPYSKKLYKNGFHNGVDFAASIGTPVYAAADGVVQMAGNNGRVQYGKYVLIKHDNGLTTISSHLSRHAVKTGDQVRRGELIGYAGNTGYAKGAHLHFGVYLSSTVILKAIGGAGLVPVGYTLDPTDYL